MQLTTDRPVALARSVVLGSVLLASVLLASGCWEWDIFVPENPNACGIHIPPVTGALAVVSFTLLDVDTKAPVPGMDPIPAGATLNLAALPARLNVRANTSPPVVGGVAFNLDGVNGLFESAPPYMLAGDKNCGSEYHVWAPPAAGTHILLGTALRGATADSERGGTATLSFTIQ